MSPSTHVQPDPTDIVVSATKESEVAELSAFLRHTFNLRDTPLHSPRTIAWKYFRRDGPPTSFIARAGTRLVAHMGHAPRALTVQAGGSTHVSSAVHFMDWVSAPEALGAGALLLMQGVAAAPVAYLLGGTAIAQRVSTAFGFRSRGEVALLRSVLRPWHRLRTGGLPWRGLAAGARDLARKTMIRRPARTGSLRLVEVSRFSGEPESVMANVNAPLAYTERSSPLLNYLLECPVHQCRGYAIEHDHRLSGFALTNLLTDERGVRHGRILDCFLGDAGGAHWTEAVTALAQQMGRDGADIVDCYAATPAVEEACTRSGFTVVMRKPVLTRDRARLLPAGLRLYLSRIEADHALY